MQLSDYGLTTMLIPGRFLTFLLRVFLNATMAGTPPVMEVALVP